MVKAKFLKRFGSLGLAILAGSAVPSFPSWASTGGSLEDALNRLSMPENQAPGAISEEKLYAVQTRYSPLTFRSELSLGGARNFTGDRMLETQQLDLAYRFHLSNRWSLGISGSYVFNTFSDTADRLMKAEGILPDIAYAKYRGDLTVTHHLFYGKFRASMDRVFYFDQYVSLGGGVVGLNTGRVGAAVADLGFAFWIGRNASLRVGLKDYYYLEQRAKSSGWSHNLLGHFDVGYVFGGDET